MPKESQCQRVLGWLRRGRSLNRRQAMNRLNVCNLSARISDLRKQGYPIVIVPTKHRPFKLDPLAKYRLGVVLPPEK